MIREEQAKRECAVVTSDDMEGMAFSVNAVEDSTIYKFYAEHLTECNIPFRMIEHMLENYKTLKQSLKEILSELNID